MLIEHAAFGKQRQRCAFGPAWRHQQDFAIAFKKRSGNVAVHSLHERDSAVAEHHVQVFAVNRYSPYLVNILNVKRRAQDLAIESDRVGGLRLGLCLA